MNYTILFIIALLSSFIAKIYLYPKTENEKYMNWISNMYTKNKANFLIDIFLVVTCFIFYNRYHFSTRFFSNTILTSILLVIAIIDIRTKIIPDRLVLSGMFLGGITTLLNNEISILSGLIGLIICGGIIAVISITTKGAVGMGDAKLLGCIGIFLGIQNTLGVMLISTMLSGLAGLFLLAFRIANIKTTLPFAPFISVAAIFMMIVN